MAESNWEQKKKHALTSLNILLDIWQARRPLIEIISTGPECNNAVLALGLETDLPLPYDEEKMSGTSLAAIFGAKDRSGGPDDEASNNIKAWIQLTEKAEYEPTKEEVKTLVLTKTFPSAETAWPVEEDRDLISQAAASEMYDIPKSTLSKYAGKKPNELNYLWSIKKGKRRYYRKSDIVNLAESRGKIRLFQS